jgi:WD40 repeat protein
MRLTTVFVLVMHAQLVQAQPEPPALQPGAIRLGNTRSWHPDKVVSVTFAPSGSVFASTDVEGRVRLWDAESGKLLREFRKGTGTTIAFSPDSKHLATTGHHGPRLEVWSLSDGQQLPFDNGSLGPVTYAPDGKSIICCDGIDVVRVAADTGKEIKRYKGFTKGATSVAMSHDGKWVAAGANDAVLVWDAATSKERYKLSIPKEGVVSAVAFAPDDKTLASATPVGVWLWDARTGEHLADFGHEACYDVAFDKTGKRLVTGGQVGVIDVEKKTVVRWMKQGFNFATAVALSPDGKTIISNGVYDERIRFWDAETGKELLGKSGHTDEVTGVACSPNGKFFATGSGGDGTIRLWDATGAEVHVFRLQGERNHFSREFGLWGLAFSPNSKELTACGQRWDVASGKALDTLQVERVSTLAFSPDGRTAVGGGWSPNFVLIDTATGRVLRRLSPQGDDGIRVRGRATAVFSPDGKRLAIAAVQENAREIAKQTADTIHLYDVASGQRLRSFRPEQHWAPGWMAFAPDGNMLATATGLDQPTQLWDTTTGKLVRELKGQETPGRWSEFRPVAFSPDGHLLATGGNGDTVVLWEVLSGKPVQILTGHTRPVRSLAFSPDGSRLISGGADTTAVIWPVVPRGKDVLLPEQWDAKTGDALWHALAAEPSEAYRAIGSLVAAPDRVVGVFKDRLKPDPIVDEKELARLVDALGATEFTDREEAAAQLKRHGPVAGPALRRALTSDNAEVVRRAEELLKALASQQPSADELRAIRSVQTLERVGLADAEALLETLARGADSGPTTIAARAALIRLDNKRTAARNVEPAARTKPLYTHAGEVLAVAITPDSKIALSGGKDGKVRRWDMVAGRELAGFPSHPGGAFAVAISGDGKQFATAGADGKVRLIGANGEEHVLAEFKRSVYAVAFSPDGRHLATGGGDGTARVWDIETRKERWSVLAAREGAEVQGGSVTGVAFTADGKALVTAGILAHGNTVFGEFVPNYTAAPIQVWAAEDGKLLRTIDAKGYSLTAIPGGQILVGGVTSSAMIINSNEEGAITLLAARLTLVDAKTAKVERDIEGIGSGAISPDGRLLAAVPGSAIHINRKSRLEVPLNSKTNRLRLFEVATGNEMLALPGEPPTVLTFAPDGKSVLYGTATGEVGLADIQPSGVDVPEGKAALERAWESLRSEDAEAMYRAVVALAANPQDTPAFLKAKLAPAPADDPTLVGLIGDLDAPRYVVRRAALLELERRGAEAVPALTAASTRNIPAHIKKQIEALLAVPGAKKFPDPLRRDRAIWALERIGTQEARAVIAGVR